jgi:hypothetical protein
MEGGVEGGHKSSTYARGVVVMNDGWCWVTKGSGKVIPPVSCLCKEREVVVSGFAF